MGNRFGIFNYATQTPGGYVDVDFFEYSRITEAEAMAMAAAPEEI
jgi:hypothetical protein